MPPVGRGRAYGVVADLIAVPLVAAPLWLTPLTVTDADAMAEVLADPALYAVIGGGPPTVDQLREQYRRQLAGPADHSEHWLTWIIRDHAEQPVGFVQATVRSVPAPPEAELAWVLGTPWHGRGYAGIAARAVVAWLRNQRVEHLCAHIAPGHTASERVATAIGLHPTPTVVDGEVRWAADVAESDG